MNLTPEQQQAVDRAVTFVGKPSAPWMTIGGLAGTGKTTILAALCDELTRLGKHFIVGTPTGKAASVLKAKGVPAATIHRLAYECQGKNKHGELIFDFVGIKREEGDVRHFSCFLIDEASMVSTPIFQDLLSVDVPLVFIGDYGQLPPVGGDPGLMKSLDVELKEVHRQAGHLLDVCYTFREGRTFAKHFREHPDVARYCVLGVPPAADWMREADVVLTGFNATRHSINAGELLRLGVDVGPLQELDKARTKLARQLVAASFDTIPVVCTSNDYITDIMNGETGFLRCHGVEAPEHPPEDGKQPVPTMIHGEWFDERPQRGEPGRQVWINAASLFTSPGVDAVPFHAPGLKIDFAWALTVHKAQGSEWNHVAVVDQGFGKDPETYRRWRYTAATRAKQRLTWLGQRRIK